MNVENCSISPSHSIKISEEEAAFGIIQNAVLDLWQVVDNLTRIRPPSRDHYTVSIFGSARLHSAEPLYQDVRDLAHKLTLMGCDIVTGGGPGLMQAANEGTAAADPRHLKRSIGIRVDLDFEQETNPFVGQLYCHQTFFSRLHHFVLISDAFVVVPGGVGTTLEALMIWQLIQTRKLQDTPLIFVGEMWRDLVGWAEKHMLTLDLEMAAATDFSIPKCVDRFEDAIALLQDAHGQWKTQNSL